ncbi:hypothetical protein [Nitrobacter sp.]|uniref:hypothetical protein n=1 Tax=unclassified Nitrobacter TaxID=2620411 RepID=UPI003220236C
MFRKAAVRDDDETPSAADISAGTARAAASRQSLDHDDFGSDRSKIMNVIDFNILERDAGGKPLHTFPHPALERRPVKWNQRRRSS